MLLEFGASPNAICDWGTTPLQLAENYGHAEVAALLREPPAHRFGTSPAGVFSWQRELQLLTFMLGILPVPGAAELKRLPVTGADRLSAPADVSELPDDVLRLIGASLLAAEATSTQARRNYKKAQSTQGDGL